MPVSAAGEITPIVLQLTFMTTAGAGTTGAGTTGAGIHSGAPVPGTGEVFTVHGDGTTGAGAGTTAGVGTTGAGVGTTGAGVGTAGAGIMAGAGTDGIIGAGEAITAILTTDADTATGPTIAADADSTIEIPMRPITLGDDLTSRPDQRVPHQGIEPIAVAPI